MSLKSHLNSQALGKLVINFINKIRSCKMSWQVAGSFPKNLFDCDFSQNREISCPEVEESGSSDKTNIISIIYMKSGLKIQIG